MIRPRGRLAPAVFAAALAGCTPSVPLAPPPAFIPVSMQIAPGLGFSMNGASVVYLVVTSPQTKNKPALPRLTEVLVAEFRAATSAEVVVLEDSGLDCPPAAQWTDLCQACQVPIEDAPPGSVVVFCELQEYDPYTPLRVGLSLRVRRATDGAQLTGLQGIWVGPPPMQPPPLPPFHWFYRRLPPRPNVEFIWTAQFEAQSATELFRNAAHQSVEMLAAPGTSPQQGFSPAAAFQSIPELIPPAPPALPEIMPPPPELTSPSGSDSSIPEESHPSP